MKSKKSDIREHMLKILDLAMKINSLPESMVFFHVSPHVGLLSVRITTSNYLEVIKTIDIYYDWKDGIEKLKETGRYLERYLKRCLDEI